MLSNGAVKPSGSLGLKVIRGEQTLQASVWPCKQLTFKEVVAFGLPNDSLPESVNDWRASNVRNMWRGAKKVFVANKLDLQHMYGQLFLTVFRANGDVENLRLASMRLVTTTGGGFIVDAFQNLVELEIMKYHGLGTGNT